MIIEKVTKEEDFYNLREQWDNLLNESRLGNIFLTWEWLHTWWTVFRNSSRRLYLLLVKENNALIGIAPLYQEKNIFFKQIRFLGDGIVCSDYLGFIISPQFKEQGFKVFLDYLARNRRDWDFLNFEVISMDKRQEAIFDAWCRENKYILGEKKTIPCPYIKLPATEEMFVENLSDDFRKKIAYELRRLEKLGKVEWLYYDDRNEEKEVQRKFDEFVVLHKKRWEGRGYLRRSPFSNKRFLEFHRKIMEIFLAKKWVHFFCLDINSKTIAAHYNFIFCDRLFHYLPTFDMDWSRYSPGQIILFDMIRYAISKDIKIFDFLRGDEPYKMRLSKSIYIEKKIIAMRKSSVCFFYLLINRLVGLLKGY